VRSLGEQLVGPLGHLVGAGKTEQAPQLCQWLGVIVDADVEALPPRLARRGHEQQRR
jgi:hypothetical protein